MTPLMIALRAGDVDRGPDLRGRVGDRRARRGARLAAPARGLPDPRRARPGDAGADQRARLHAVVGEPHRSRETVHAGRVRRGDRAASSCSREARRTSTSTRSSCMKLLGIVSVIVWVPLGLRVLKFQRDHGDRGHRAAVGRVVPLSRRAPQPQDRRSPERDLAEAARHPRPPRDLGGSRPRLRAGARPHVHGRARCAVRRVPANAPRDSHRFVACRCAPRDGRRAPRFPSCARSSSPCSRPTPSVCRSRGCSAPRPTRCASVAGSARRSRRRRRRSRCCSRWCSASSRRSSS